MDPELETEEVTDKEKLPPRLYMAYLGDNLFIRAKKFHDGYKWRIVVEWLRRTDNAHLWDYWARQKIGWRLYETGWNKPPDW